MNPQVSSASRSTTLRIDGMTCSSCRKHVASALGRVPGVTSVEVDLGAGKASVVHDATTPTAALLGAVEAAGYGASTLDGSAR